MSKIRFSITDSLWVRGEAIAKKQRNAISETQALLERGAKVFFLKGAQGKDPLVGRIDNESLKQLKQLLWKNDAHIILGWLHPSELNGLLPLLRERKNFSIIVDDWWVHPHWFIREAEYVLFRKYHGIAVRLGKSTFLNGHQAPLLLDPRAQISKYSLVGAALRPLALAAAPFANLWKKWQRLKEPIVPERLLYFPFSVEPANIPISPGTPKYDFANTGGCCGIWLMRDAYAPFQHTFANLYHDRRVLTDAIAGFENNPFKFYDCRRENRTLPYHEYILKNQQSRFLITSGGLHDSTVPKYTEYAGVGTPMIGRGLPFEYPWLDDCLFPVDMMNATPSQIKPLLHQALDCYPKLRENCLNCRDRLIKLYDLQTLLDVLQIQADGNPVPPGYLKVDLKLPAGKP